MRTILFRGQRIDTKEFIYGSLIINSHAGVTVYVIATEGMGSVYSTSHAVIPKTVSQFIDMNDKNGVKIFEGDIYKLPTGDKFKIEFHSGCFVSVNKDNRQIGLTGELQECFIEIIGNIHDNPEVLTS